MLELRFLRGKISPVVDGLHTLTCVCLPGLTDLFCRENNVTS